MSIKNIGTTQLTLLKRGYQRGYVNASDVQRYYPIRNSRKIKGTLEKLETRGLLTKITDQKWILTEAAIEIIKDIGRGP